MIINGKTIPFAVLGHPVAHSLSPAMHNASLRELGMNAAYTAYDVEPDHLMDTLRGMWRMGFRGVNLTIPLKEVAFAGITRCDHSAEIAGAVNTVAFDEEGLRGYSTDGVGFLNDLQECFATAPKGQRVLILGCGGVGRTLAITCAEQGAAEVMLANRTQERAEVVADEIPRFAPDARVTLVPQEQWSTISREADIIIQCTSHGMNPGEAPLLPATAFREGQILYDTIYVSPTTPLMAVAESAGSKTANGLGMLLHQGAESFRIWTGMEPDTRAMRTALENSVY